MMQLLARILVGLVLLSFLVVPAHAVIVNRQNQIFVQPDEKLTITYISSSATHRGQIFNIYTPTTQKTIDTSSSNTGETVVLGAFSKDTEIVFQLLDPRTGFSYYNDPRNNVDLANHIQITDLGQGKWTICWKHDQEDESYDDLVIMIQKSSPAPSTTPQRSAASSWQLYE